MYELRWNKAHTKVRVWSTICDGYVSKFMELKKARYHPDPVVSSLVLREVYKLCPYCYQKLPEN